MVLRSDGHRPRVTIQVFQKEKTATVCGVDHALAILHAGTGYYGDPKQANRLFATYLQLEREAYRLWLKLRQLEWTEYEKVAKQVFDVSQELDRLWVNCFQDLTIRALYDGERAGAREPVLEIEGDLSTFAHLETLYCGSLTDGTMVASNAVDVVEAAGDKPILMFGARHQSHESQAGSGYAAYIAGAHGVSTDEQGEFWGSRGLGTIPHALIAAYGGDTVRATLKFAEYIDPDVNVISLVDFDNDSVNTSLAVAHALGGRLWGVRLDTAETVVDKAVFDAIQSREYPSEVRPTGVNEMLVHKVRQALDSEGFPEVKIVVSGGFDREKIERFERQGVPVDAYGVGSALYRRKGGRFEYTADVVRVFRNGTWNDTAKVGRQYKPSGNLHPVNLEDLLDF